MSGNTSKQRKANQSCDGEIRRPIGEAALVDCMVTLPGQLFCSTRLTAKLEEQFAESETLERAIRGNLKGLGYGG